MLKLSILLIVLGVPGLASALDLTGCNLAPLKTSALHRRVSDWSAQWQRFSAAWDKWSSACDSSDPQSKEFAPIDRTRRSLGAGAAVLKSEGEGLMTDLAQFKGDSQCSAVVAKVSDEMRQEVQKLNTIKTKLARKCKEPPPAEPKD